MTTATTGRGGDTAPVVHTLGEAADILRVKPSWLERQAAARKIPFTMLGGSYKFTTKHLADIVRINEKTPSAEPEREARKSRFRGQRQVRPTDIPDVAPLRARPRNGPREAA